MINGSFSLYAPNWTLWSLTMTSSENMLTLAGAQVSGPEQQGTPRTQDKRSHLLPPLQHPSMQAAPPLHRLPGGDVTPERIVLTTATASCSPTMWVATTHVFPAVSQPKGSDVRQLWSCIQRIVPVRPAGLERKGRGFTLLLCHPVGLHKEVCAQKPRHAPCELQYAETLSLVP